MNLAEDHYVFTNASTRKNVRSTWIYEEQAREQFGFLLDAFDYGTPPHGGFAFGLDRIVMLLSGSTNLRDTIAFPKTASASCLLTSAPDRVDDNQLAELGIHVLAENKK